MILGFFFMLFLIFLFIIMIGSSIIRSIFNLFLGRPLFRQPFGHTAQGQRTTKQSAHQSRSQQSSTSDSKKREKIFDKTEGEYVDFEEIED